MDHGTFVDIDEEHSRKNKLIVKKQHKKVNEWRVVMDIANRNGAINTDVMGATIPNEKLESKTPEGVE